MNFKIEINYLNIDNYPSFEKHLEEMASKGWLINKIFLGFFFLYKKADPKELDFSISPYEIETMLTRKAKTDLEEFHEVSKNVGWEYATKTYDLHIYFKPKDSIAVPLHTDEEEEFNTAEIIIKKHLKSHYFLLVLLIILAWFNISRLVTTVDTMKDGFLQITVLLLPFGILDTMFHIFDLTKFLKRNRKNIENGDSLEFSDSQRRIYKFIYRAFFILFICLILFSLYSIFVLKNFIILVALLPIILGYSLGFLFRRFVKPIRKGKAFKLAGFFVMLILAFVLGEYIISDSDFDFLTDNNENLLQSDYRVLSYDIFSDSQEEEQNDLTRNASLFIPKSYDYVSLARNKHLATEYSDALNESIAESLVDRYIQQGKSRAQGRFSYVIEMAFVEGYYDSYLSRSGFSKEEYNSLYNDMAEEDFEVVMDKVSEMVVNKAITKDEDLWDLDEVYFLNYEKNEIVIRDGTVVFYLDGLDFSDPSVISKAKERLNLN